MTTAFTPAPSGLSAYERLLAECMVDMLADLRQVDMDQLAALVLAGAHANIEDLVHSATELFFRERTVSYAWSSEVEIAWGQPPVLHLDLEFQFGGVFLAFRASLRAADAGLTLRALMFDDAPAEGHAERDRLLAALAAARRAPLQR